MYIFKGKWALVCHSIFPEMKSLTLSPRNIAKHRRYQLCGYQSAIRPTMKHSVVSINSSRSTGSLSDLRYMYGPKAAYRQMKLYISRSGKKGCNTRFWHMAKITTMPQRLLCHVMINISNDSFKITEVSFGFSDYGNFQWDDSHLKANKWAVN